MWAKRVASFAKDESLAAETRASLLEILAAYDSSSALPLAVEWAEKNEGGEGATAPYRKALDVRLALDPQGAWPMIEAAYRKRGADALRDLSSLWQRRADFGANLSQWPTGQLNCLAQILMETFPLPAETEHPPDDWILMGTDDELRDVRNRVLSMLIQRRLDGDTSALSSLFETQPQLKERFEWETQRREALRLLGNLGQSLASESPPLAIAGIPVEQVVRLLDEADYRLIRSGDDLSNALVHVLRQVDEGAPYDLSMLYGRNEPVKPSRRSKGKLGKKQVRKRLEEEALQAYVRRRMDDMLPSAYPESRSSSTASRRSSVSADSIWKLWPRPWIGNGQRL